MMFLLLALPIGLLAAYLSFLTWRGGHLQVALMMGVLSAVCMLIGAVPLVFAWLCTQAPSVQF
ncbi:MAG: hypothetical protein GWN87_23050 [Desulfuromonadales bacterium]|nr:hypothetical protein [Desulfuromonadales bacterium]NIS42763.1 hypothetical protein [Desulfuromonadales bacterium]